jgi:hypothetical protein
VTPADIRDLLFLAVDEGRVKKAKALAMRQRIDWSLVVAEMTEAQRKAVESASSL